MGSELNILQEKLLAVESFAASQLFDAAEVAALIYADAMTLSDHEVTDEIFAELQSHYTDDAIVELTEVIAWENASSKFNRALRIPSQNLWQRKSEQQD